MTHHMYHFPGAYDYQPAPTLAQLRARRLEALQIALGMYRREHACHPNDASREEWTKARLYWTQQAYHAHGEIMARTPPEQRTDFVGWDYDERGHRSPIYQSDIV